ncbi:hypothetical protein [Fibrivirga algicola]|uniref:Uncharacterized protein n=1 Tax=Fibrivirga algicola TaxID=2950420 RepID=A0ABX0QE87_9BACT|nr:hypothetical protein [Fibrivirga algicola]NID10734.1 hypothetical protein [Fibrivirga algicola]
MPLSMNMLDTLVAIAYVATNAFAVVQVIGTYRWPTVTRVLFAIFFGVAAVVNIRTVLTTPWVYQSYADYSVPVYSRFILGPFEAIIQPMVLCIAVGQALIAGTMFMKGAWFRLGCVSGILFGILIAPLGLGAAFPATLLLSVAFYRLYRNNNRTTIADVITNQNFYLPID